ncbi:MAG: aminopeptidase P N-terminal domain-containing protein, partial [Acidobacteria bacterium]|nr:aminopeptidase P N-terminal domain-containing protein [Acidobacteriota bacterium]
MPCLRTFLPVAFLLTLHSAPVLAQSDVAFPKEIYAGRRAIVAALTGDGLIIVTGRYPASDSGTVKQDANFWYLTGVESPYSILVLAQSHTGEGWEMVPHSQSTLFLPKTFEFAGGQFPSTDEAMRRAVWNRPLRRLAPGKSASEATGIQETFPIGEFAERLKKLAEGKSTIYLPLDEMKVYSPPGMTAPLTWKQQFAKSISELLPDKKIEDLTPILQRLRLVKDSYEIAALRKAAEISG